MVFMCINVPPMQKRLRPAALAVPTLLTALLLAACGGPTTSTADQTTATPSAGGTAEAGTAASASELQEVSAITPRVVIAHDGGLTVLDTATGETLSETDRSGLLRLSPSGDGRHVMVADGDRFLAFDAALKSRPHGDHAHHYAGTPELRDLAYESPASGHVVVHDGLTALFSDGEGSVRIVPTDQVAGGYRAADGVIVESGAPHHGVAVPFADGSLLITVGTDKERTTIQHRAADGTVLAETADCPKIHGEATGADDTAAFGCVGGPVVFDGTEFHKVPLPAGVEFQKSGTLAGHPDSPIFLSDHKTDEQADKDGTRERPTQISLIDSRTNTMQAVELGSAYSFRTLARGPHAEALVLTGDGALKVIDPESGEITADIPAISEWRENDDWQEPGPILKVVGHTAYVTDAAKKELVLIDLLRGEVTQRFSLDVTPFEIAVVDGVAAADAASDDHAHGNHEDHEGHEGHAH